MAFAKVSILVAEDKTPQRNEIIQVMKKKLGDDIDITIAGTVETLIQKLQIKAETGNPVDVLVLDYLLPDSDDSPDKRQINLWYKLERFGIGFTIYISSQPDDQIRETIINIQRDFDSKVSDIISKTEMGWTIRIAEEIQRYSAEKPIRDAMRELFSPSIRYTKSGSYRYKNENDTHHSATHRLSKLYLDIQENWDFLGEVLRQRIQDVIGDDWKQIEDQE